MKNKNHLYARIPYPIVPESDRVADWRYQLMELSSDALLDRISSLSREQLTEWLAWNDVNGVFLDADCLALALS